MSKKWISVFGILVLVGVGLPVHAQDADIIEPVAFTTGIIAPDGNVNYSVLFVNGTDPLSDVTINLTLPEGATFVATFSVFDSEEFVGQQNEDGSIQWQVAEVAADTTIGPFTAIAAFENQAEPDFAPPAGAIATVQFGDQTLAAIVPEGTLTPLAESGSITLDAAGTGGEFVQVGETGVWILLEPDAISTPITLTFTRLPINDETPLPEVAEDTWWCSMFTVAVEQADVELADVPLIILYPTRRTLAPGTPVVEFTQLGDEWQILTNDVARLPANTFARPNRQDSGGSVIAGGGNHVVSRRTSGPRTENSAETVHLYIVGIDLALEDQNHSNGYINAYNSLVSYTTLPTLVGGPPAITRR